MALGKDYEGQDCSLARALELLGERWTLLVVRDAFYGIRRYSDFASHLEIPRAVLAERLQTLTAAGVLRKHRYKESPPRDEYVLTEMGLELWPIILAMGAFGGRHLSPGGPCRRFFHAGCGTELDTSGTCPTCSVYVVPADVEMRLGPGAREDAGGGELAARLREPRRLLTPLVG